MTSGEHVDQPRARSQPRDVRARAREWVRRVREVAEPRPQHRWGFGAFLAVLAVLVFGAVGVSTLWAPGPVTEVQVLAGTIVPTLLATAAALGVARWRGNGPRIDFAWRATRSDLLAGAKVGAGGLVLTVLAVAIWTRAVGEHHPTSAVGALVGEAHFSVPGALVMFGYTVAVGPLCEEILFRGLCWGALDRWGPFTAFWLSTAIFAASHLEPSRTALLLVIGLPVGLARLVTGSLGASVVAHQVNNFLPGLAALLAALGALPA